MEETDMGRMLAAAAPAADAVPPVGDLAGRARALGRRRRVQLFAARGGGAGLAVAAVAGMVVALGGFGGGAQSVSAGSGSGAAPALGTKSGPGTPMLTYMVPGDPTPHTGPIPQGNMPSSLRAVSDPAANKKVADALKAALPAQDAAELSLLRGDGTGRSYGADFLWGPQSQGGDFYVSVAPMQASQSPHTPSVCQIDPAHCTTGTATLRGHQVRWEYTYGDPRSHELNIYDDQALTTYLVGSSVLNTRQPLGLDVLKGVGLNEQFADALIAAVPKH